MACRGFKNLQEGGKETEPSKIPLLSQQRPRNMGRYYNYNQLCFTCVNRVELHHFQLYLTMLNIPDSCMLNDSFIERVRHEISGRIFRNARNKKTDKLCPRRQGFYAKYMHSFISSTCEVHVQF